jgi:Eukaryotic aspartyl protease
MSQRYLVDLTIGTPPQHFALALDSGSTDIWVPTANSSGCRPNCPPPTFDPADSATIRALGLPFNATYGLTPDLRVPGEYYNDTLRLGRAIIPNMTGRQAIRSSSFVNAFQVNAVHISMLTSMVSCW